MKSIRKVSCLMPTYLRPPTHKHLIEESIESFFRQDYKNKELIILNDCPGQKLIFSHPKVNIINTNRRIRSLGEKYNIMASIAKGDILCPWEDDDISLPWRISLSTIHLNKNSNIDYWRPRNHWILKSNKLIQSYNVNPTKSQSIYKRSAFDKAKGYRHISFMEDDMFESDIIMFGGSLEFEDLEIEKWFFLYRKNTGSYHTSSMKDVYEKLEKIEIIPGDYVLNPHWRIDYEREIKKRIINLKKINQI